MLGALKMIHELSVERGDPRRLNGGAILPGF